MPLKHAFTNPKSDGGDATVVRPSDWNADHIVDSGGILMDSATADPSAPAADHLIFYAKKVAGRSCPKIIGPSGIDAILQNFLGQDKVAWWSAPGNATTVPTVSGAAALTAVVAGAAVTVTSTNMINRMKRIRYSSAATASAINSARGGVAQFTLGVPGTPNLGGFFTVIRFGLASALYTPGATTGGRGFFGMWATASAPTNVEPTTLVNCIGVGYGASDTALRICFGGSVAQTSVSLGTNFPVNTTGVDAYELILFAPPNLNNTVYYKVTRLNTGHVAEGTLTAATPGTQLPLNTTMLCCPVMWVANNSALLVAQSFDFVSAYISTDQ